MAFCTALWGLNLGKRSSNYLLENQSQKIYALYIQSTILKTRHKPKCYCQILLLTKFPQLFWAQLTWLCAINPITSFTPTPSHLPLWSCSDFLINVRFTVCLLVRSTLDRYRLRFSHWMPLCNTTFSCCKHNSHVGPIWSLLIYVCTHPSVLV